MGNQEVVAQMGSCTIRHVQSVERRAERERQPQRQRLERQLDLRWRAQLSSFQTAAYLGAAVCLLSCPTHPPIILPIPAIFSEIAIYCLSLSESDSQSTMSIILIVSTLRMAKRT